MGMCPHMPQKGSACMPMCAFFWNLEVDLRGLLMFKKCLKTLFCSKYTQKLPKNSNLLQSCRMTMGVLSPRPTTVQ